MTARDTIPAEVRAIHDAFCAAMETAAEIIVGAHGSDGLVRYSYQGETRERWVRNGVPLFECRIVCALNPPTMRVESEWITEVKP